MINLRWDDIDAERGTIFIREGKGKVDRMVPVGERALAWCAKYLHEIRPQFDLGGHDPAFFLTSLGEAFTPNRMTQLVRTSRRLRSANQARATCSVIAAPR